MENFLQTFFSWNYIKQVLPDLFATGLKNTLILAISASVFGFILAMVLAMLGLSSRWAIRLPARIFTDVFRGLPAILTILLLGEGLAPLGLKMFGPSPYPLAILALALITAAYTGEILRAGIQSVEKGQLEGARALGMTRSSALLLVVIPQGIRRVLPSLVNQFIAVIKDSSLVYFLGLVASEREIFRIGQDSAVTNANLSPLVAAGALYLLMTVPLTHLINYIDKRLREGRPHPAEPLIVDGEAAPDQRCYYRRSATDAAEPGEQDEHDCDVSRLGGHSERFGGTPRRPGAFRRWKFEHPRHHHEFRPIEGPARRQLRRRPRRGRLHHRAVRLR